MPVISPNSRQLVAGNVKGGVNIEGDGPWLVVPLRSVTSEHPVMIAKSVCYSSQVNVNVYIYFVLLVQLNRE